MAIMIGGETFNFTESGYTPPSASGTVYNFQYIGSILNQIWSDDNYVYAVCDSGLDIISMSAEQKIAYIEYELGFNTVWANDNRIYLGTTSSGVKYINKTCISGTVESPVNLITWLADYTSPFGMSSQNVRYIHGNNDFIMWCTNLGVDVYKMEPYGYRSTTTTSGAQKCFMTSTGKFYYTSVSGNEWCLNRIDKPLWDWTIPDYIYNTGGDVLSNSLEINDIFITENTASNTIDNTVFIATTSGVYVVDEGSLDYVVYYTTGG